MSDQQEQTTEPFTWRGSECGTIGTLLAAATAAADAGDGAEFMTAYRAVNSHADQNIGYIIGYIGGSDTESVDRRAELNRLLGVAHPIGGVRY